MSTHQELRLLAVHAHPDDESSKGSATLAHYRSQGARAMVATCTGGERGDVLNEKVAHDPAASRDIAGVRRREMRAAQEALGIEHRWLGFMDSGLPEGDPLPPLPFGSFGTLDLEVAAEPLVRLVRDFKPHVIVSYDENGGYPHPDHIMAHRVAVEAFHAAGDPARYPGAGEAWEPLKLYYDMGFSIDRLAALDEALKREGIESPFEGWIARRMENEKELETRNELPPHLTRAATTRVPCVEHFDARDEALRCHATQVDPEGFFFLVPRDVEKAAWPTEDYALIESRVDTPALRGEIERDLFESVHAMLGVGA